MRIFSVEIRLQVLTGYLHRVESVRIRSYSGSYFPTFGLNTERYRVQSISPCSVQMRENTEQINSEYGHFLRSAKLEKNS